MEINDGDRVELSEAFGTGVVDLRYRTSNPDLVWVKWETGQHIGYYLSPVSQLRKIATTSVIRDRPVTIGGKNYGTISFDPDRKRAYFLPLPDQYLSDIELDSILRFVKAAECRMVTEVSGRDCGNINSYGQCACHGDLLE